MLRKVILFILGLLILFAAFMVAQKFVKNKKIPKPRAQKIVTTVFSQTAQNNDIPLTISTNGNLAAKYKMEIFAEVQGVFNKSAREFKPGTFYKKGDLLLEINSDEHKANLRAQKSALYNQLVLLLPDLRLDYEASFPAWENYLNEFNLNESVKPFPEPQSQKEKLFISGKNVYTTYYTVKNLEERLVKYKIVAPYSGVLIDGVINSGTLIRAGQKLGEFINPNVYELQVPVNVAYTDMVKVGQNVAINNIENTKTWTGKIIRINSIVDQGTQSIQVFIKVSGNDLKEGMYLQAELAANEVQNAIEISRKLLVNDDNIFIVRDTILDILPVDPIFFKENTVVLQGVPEGAKILARPLPGAYKGMIVKAVEETSNSNSK